MSNATQTILAAISLLAVLVLIPAWIESREGELEKDLIQIQESE